MAKKKIRRGAARKPVAPKMSLAEKVELEALGLLPEPEPDETRLAAWRDENLFGTVRASVAEAVPSRVAEGTLSCGCAPLELDRCPHWATRPTSRADEFHYARAQADWWLREAARKRRTRRPLCISRTCSRS